MISLRNFFLVLFLCIGSFSFAFADDLIITQFPDNPKEGEQVTLTVSSDKYDLNQANITWTVDGTEVDQGVGRKTLAIKTSQNGLAQIVAVKVEQSGFDSASAQKVVEANTNFILYEGADSIVPLFYKGRRLPPKEGTVRVAIFSFKDGNIVGLGGVGTHNYTWRINGEEKPKMGGENRIINNIIPMITDNALDIKVIKQDSSDGSSRVSQIKVPLQSPELMLYRTDDSRLLKTPIGDTEVGKTLRILVEPFFFTGSSKSDPDLLYTWKIDDVTTKPGKPWDTLLTAKVDRPIKINLDLINNKKISQSAARGFTYKSK